MFFVIGSDEETHSKYMYDTMQKKGYDVEYFDTRKYPKDIQINFQPEINDGCFKINSRKILFKDIQGFYWRWYYGVMSGKTDDDYVNNIIYRERLSALTSIFQSIKCNWVNSYTAIELHKSKSYQLNIMAQNNIRIPKTLITNDKEELIKFYETHNKNVIYKPVLGGALTEKLKETDLTSENLNRLIVSPIQVQEYIDSTDIRVFASQDNVFAAEIRANTLDFRGDDSAEIIPVNLPKNIENDCKKVLKCLSLTYSGIDIRRSNNGEYVFLEANPAPMFIHFEKKTGYPITEMLINLLTK